MTSERIFIKTHGLESRCVIGQENILFAGVSVHLSARKLYRLQCCSVVSEQTVLGRLQGAVMGGWAGRGRGFLFIVLVHTSFLILTGSVVSKPRILGRFHGCCYGGWGGERARIIVYCIGAY